MRATDAAGNTDATQAVWSWTIDTAAPDTTITGGPASPTNQTTASFTFTADEPSTFGCRLDDDPLSACSSPKNYSELSDGHHVFEVQAADEAGKR